MTKPQHPSIYFSFFAPFILFLGFGFFPLLHASDHAESPIFGGPLPLSQSSLTGGGAFSGNSSDICDLYTFTSGTNIVLAMTVIPLQPAISTISSTNFSKYIFSPDVLYQFHIDNNADLVADHVIKCRFSLATSDGRQYIRVTGIPNKGTLEGEINTPLTNNTVKTVTSSDSTAKIFAGPREDPFFMDLVGFKAGFNFIFGDNFKSTNVSAIVIEFPYSLVLATNNTTLKIWVTTLGLQ